MQHTNLNSSEIRDLIDKYTSEIRKLEHERHLLERAIAELKVTISSGRTADAPPVFTPPVAVKPTKTKWKFKKSRWDELVLQELERGDAITSGYLWEVFLRVNEEEKINLDEKQLRNALSRTLHKLSNKKRVVNKLDYPGKGFFYQLVSE